MNGSEFQRLVETARLRKLTAEETTQLRSHLAEHPEAQAHWEEELQLTELLRQLPDVPVSSNFTARVLQALDREEAALQRLPDSRVGWRRWFPRLAIGGSVALLTVTILLRQQQQRENQEQLAASVAAVSSVAALPTLEMLRDFEAIHRLSQISASADAELLAALQ